jgi:hypothetical protein
MEICRSLAVMSAFARERHGIAELDVSDQVNQGLRLTTASSDAAIEHTLTSV